MTDQQKKYPRTWLRDLSLLTAILIILFGSFLGSRPLLTPDEGRYVEIPREMVVSGDYLTPHLNGLKYFEKPPLYYWLETVPIHLFGLNEWGLRTISALLGIFGCLMVYSAGRMLFNRRAGWLGSLALASSLLYFVFAHLIIPDTVVTITLTACLLAFILGTREKNRGKQVLYFWAMYAFAALAVLSKGLIGALFPGMIIFAWIAITCQWRQLKTYCLPTGILLFILIAAPWHLLVQLKNPEFFHFYFVEQHFLRYFTNYADRGQPIWFFPATIILGFFPWISFFPWQLHWRSLLQQRTELFLVLWVFLIALFFTFSHSLLISYALPVMPALALLTGRYLANIWELPRPTCLLYIRFIFIALVLITIAICGVCLVHPQYVVSWYAILSLLVASAIVTLWALWQKGLRAALIALMLSFSCCLIAINLSYKNLDTRSTKPLAQALLPLLTKDTPVISFQEYYQDLPVYLQRRIILANYSGELAFGIAHQNTDGWVLSEGDLWSLWQQNARLFVVMRIKDYQQLLKDYQLHLGYDNLRFYPIAKTQKNILLTNRPL